LARRERESERRARCLRFVLPRPAPRKEPCACIASPRSPRSAGPAPSPSRPNPCPIAAAATMQLLTYVCRSLRAPLRLPPHAYGPSSLAPGASQPRFSHLTGSKLFRTLAAASSSDDRTAADFVSPARSSHRPLSPAIAATRLTVPGARMASTQGTWLLNFSFLAPYSSPSGLYFDPFLDSFSNLDGFSHCSSAICNFALPASTFSGDSIPEEMHVLLGESLCLPGHLCLPLHRVVVLNRN
jgi:hypothetical protein